MGRSPNRRIGAPSRARLPSGERVALEWPREIGLVPISEHSNRIVITGQSRYNRHARDHTDDSGDGPLIIARIKTLLEQCETGKPAFPPTTLFGECWLLRVALDWFAGHGGDRYPLSPMPGARWFSESWLPSAFQARYRGDALAESRTHADGVIGHFAIGDPGSSGLSLAPDARQFCLLEAKLTNRLSAGVKNAPSFDQAARTVACMAEVLRRADREPSGLDDLSFLILAPQARIDDGVFARDTDPEAIRRKVRARVEGYGGDRDAWLADWFEPTLARVDIRCLGWEEVIETIAFHEPEAGQLIDSFYGKCLRFNRPAERAAYPGPRAGAHRPWTYRRAEATPAASEPRRLEPACH